ncbi:Suppressor protein stp22 of temperature-sensitive alpha-factor receptor and arginine permease [Ascochyta clinopodiicola]|nr:Suppressor protein stp22 of temperature-sensitive alpha-factor receptor and arginine permease [Ascochyta clinopodiicola]
MAVPETTLNWLYSVLTSNYADVNRTYHDATEALAHYPSLAVRTDVYTYENGASHLLLNLSGTLPVTFRGATYGFPVAVWVPYAYPHESPIVYVKPDKDMLVRPGQHVSGDGRVYHPYLAQWAKYWDKSTLFNFLALLRAVFAKEPPVRSKQPQPQPQSQSPYTLNNAPAQPGPPPVPPPPAEYRRSIHATPHLPASPAPPPKPPKPHEQNRPTPPQHDRYAQPPPLPPHPPQQQPPAHAYQQPQRNSHGVPPNWQQPGPIQAQGTPQRQGSYDTSPATPVSNRSRPLAHPQTFQPAPYGLEGPVSPITPQGQRQASSYAGQAHPAQTLPHRIPAQQYPPQHGPPQQHGQPQPQQQQYRQPPQQYPSQHHQQPHQQFQQPPPQQAPPPPRAAPVNLLDDSLEVTLPSQQGNQTSLPLPPVPPNPQKDALLTALSQALVAQTRQTVASNQAAVAPLRAQQQALQTAYSRLQAELGELHQLDAALASNEQILKGAMVEADRAMDDARRRQAPDVDDVLVAPTVVGQQLYTLAAEERGIADALFVLGRALDRGRITADVFVKQTRSLAREQFLKKALVKKIAKGMALDEYQMREHATSVPGIRVSQSVSKSASSSTRAVHELSDQSSVETGSVLSVSRDADASKATKLTQVEGLRLSPKDGDNSRSVPASPHTHTTNTSSQPEAATSSHTPNAPTTTAPPSGPVQGTSADQEPLTYNEQLNAVDRLWKFKLALTVILICADIIGIGCIAWAVSTANEFRSGYDYGYDSTWSLPWGLITLSISFVWCILCVALFLIRKRPVHPGARVAMDLLLWLGFLTTALFTMIALVDLLQWGEYGTLGYSSGWSSRYGEYVLQRNNTWVWEQESDSSSVTYERTCNGSTYSTYSSNYYYTDNPFSSCAEMDAYVNALWQAKPNRARTELTGVVCQFLGLVLHFALFVWACVDCHRHRHSKVSKDAEKIAAGIVEKMVLSGAVVPPPGQAHMRTAAWQPNYHQLPSASSSVAGQGQGYVPPGQQPVYAHPMPGPAMAGQGVHPGPQRYEQPLPPLPPRTQQAGPGDGSGNGNGKGVAGSYYEPGQ